MARIAGASAGETVTDWLNRRLRLLAFEVRMWRAKACRRSSLPAAVNLKRFCAPLWVFNFSLIFLGFGNSILQIPPVVVQEPVVQKQVVRGRQLQAPRPV